MKILVTGGAGFIGSHIVDAYIAAGHKVAVLDDLSTGLRANINEQARFFQMSLADHEAVRNLIRSMEFDVVNHQAAQMSVIKSVDDPIFDATVNVVHSLHLLRECHRAKVGKFIYASTGGAVYGNPIQVPCSETADIRPVCPYGISKHTLEHYLHYYGLHGLNYTVLRYPNVYGPRQRPDGEAGVVAIFAGLLLSGKPVTIYGDGSAGRDYVHVSDIARASVLALDRGDRQIYNLGMGYPVTTNQVYQSVCNAVGSNLTAVYQPLRAGEVQSTALKSSKALTGLGWAPRIGLNAGIEDTVAWIRQKSA